MSRSTSSVDRILASIYEISRIMRQRMEQQGKERANFLHLHALLIVSEQPGITMKELARALHVTSPSATSLVNRLVKTKLVERRPDPANRKLVRLRITKTGAAQLQEKHRERTAVIRELFGLLTAAEQRTLAVLHEKVLRSYSAHRTSPSRS